MKGDALSKDYLAIDQTFYANIKIGTVLMGKIKSIQPYGVFVELAKNVTGLLHIENISVGRIRHPGERFKVGQSIKVIVKSVDFDTGKIILSHKELLGSWEENIKNFSEGDVVKRNCEGKGKERNFY